MHKDSLHTFLSRILHVQSLNHCVAMILCRDLTLHLMLAPLMFMIVPQTLSQTLTMMSVVVNCLLSLLFLYYYDFGTPKEVKHNVRYIYIDEKEHWS